MQALLVILFTLCAVLLMAVAAVTPRRATLSSFELERRRKKGDKSAADELRRMLLLDDVMSLRRVTEALLLVLAVVLAVAAFGFWLGVLVGVIVALVYGRIAHLDVVIHLVDGFYYRLEPRLLSLVERHPRLGWLMRSVTTHKESGVLSSREELDHLVQQSAGVLSLDEKKLIASTLHFNQKTVEEVMTPRGVVDTVARGEVVGPLLLDQLHRTGHSRFPVTDGDMDHIIGILHVRDILALDNKKSHYTETAMEKKVYFINQNQKLERALAAFIKTRHHMFVVVNDHRETAGIITLEDVIEALLGRKILDEFDVIDDLRALAAKNPRQNNESPAATDVK